MSNTLIHDGPTLKVREVAIRYGEWGDQIHQDKKELEACLMSGYEPFTVFMRGSTEVWFLKKYRENRPNE